MNVDLREIPPAPREVRWRAVCCRRFAALLGGGFLTGYGGLVVLMLWLADWNSHVAGVENRLDDEAQQATGVVVGVRQQETWRGQPIDVVEYRFDPPAGTAARGAIPTRPSAGRQGECFCEPGSHPVGSEVIVEYVEARPHENRILGGHVFDRAKLQWPVGLLVLPGGLVLLAIWGAGVLRLRRVLRYGDAALALPIAVRRVRLMIPAMLEVRFRFRDRHARVRDGRHWMLARSKLAEHLVDRPAWPDSRSPRTIWSQEPAPPAPGWGVPRDHDLPRLVVVHDRRQPHIHRLVEPDDFAPGPTEGQPNSTGAWQR